jgi:hypothetical protein
MADDAQKVLAAADAMVDAFNEWQKAYAAYADSVKRLADCFEGDSITGRHDAAANLWGEVTKRSIAVMRVMSDSMSAEGKRMMNYIWAHRKR